MLTGAHELSLADERTVDSSCAGGAVVHSEPFLALLSPFLLVLAREFVRSPLVSHQRASNEAARPRPLTRLPVAAWDGAPSAARFPSSSHPPSAVPAVRAPSLIPDLPSRQACHAQQSARASPESLCWCRDTVSAPVLPLLLHLHHLSVLVLAVSARELDALSFPVHLLAFCPSFRSFIVTLRHLASLPRCELNISYHQFLTHASPEPTPQPPDRNSLCAAKYRLRKPEPVPPTTSV